MKKNEIAKKESKEITLNKSKLNSFVSAYRSAEKSTAKMSILAIEICVDKATTKKFIEYIDKELGLTRTTAYALINAGKVIKAREELTDAPYSKLAEIGRIENVCDENLNMYEDAVKKVYDVENLKNYIDTTSQKKIREDVKDFNEYGEILIEAEAEEETTTEATEAEAEAEEETTTEATEAEAEEAEAPTTDIDKINNIIAMISELANASEDEDEVNAYMNAVNALDAVLTIKGVNK